MLDAVERLGIEPTACAGHSLGEYTALVASGSLSLSDGTRLVLERGDAMQQAADDRPGTMAALKQTSPDKMELAESRQGVPTGRITITLSADEKVLTMSAINLAPNASRDPSVTVFEKQ